MSKRKQEESERSCRPRAAGELVGDGGGQSFRRFGFVQSSIVSRWPEIVGERYAKVSCPESIKFPAGKKAGGALTLLVEGAHAPLIQHLAPMIMERVNRFYGYAAVNRVIFRQGKPPAPTPRPARPQLAPVPNWFTSVFVRCWYLLYTVHRISNISGKTLFEKSSTPGTQPADFAR